MNSWSGIGFMARDPEVKYSAGNQLAIVTFTLAVSRGKDKETDWIRCKAFGKTAETIEKYVHKGDQFAVTGHIQTGSYKNKNGDTVYTTDVIVESFTFCGKKREERQEDMFEAVSDPVPF